uniref:ADAM family mig-17 n=1 Tax=Magallana gigas TaxID=29159 RepID=K1QGA1_MAGGI
MVTRLLSSLISVFLLLTGGPGLTTTLTLPRHTQNQESVPVTLEIHDPTGRQKRSAGETTAENIQVKVTSPSDVTILYVKRERRHVTTPKIYSATKNGFFEEETMKAGYGSFIKDGHVHLIEPDPLAGPVEGEEVGPHVVNRIELVVDYFRDAVVIQDNEDLPLKEDSQRISRERRHVTRNTIRTDPNQQNRERRQVIKNDLYVEYGIVADYKNYQRFVKQHAIFRSADSEKYTFNIILSGIVIFNETNSPPWTQHHAVCPGCDIVDDYEVLRQFSDWSKQFLQNIIPHDHAALFTGFDLYYKDLDSPKTIGLSFLSRMCTNWSVSVIEEKMNALTVHVAAHELGHNFGASHDGSQNAAVCTATDLNLMASKMSRVTDPTKARNPWTFSACSLNSIYEYVDKLTRERRNCLLGVPALQNRNFLPQPGLVYSADEQCQSSYGNRSRVCRNYHHGDWNTLCYGLACLVPKQSECHVIFPHDGTPCGYQKWCIQGLCVNSSKASKVSEEDNPDITTHVNTWRPTSTSPPPDNSSNTTSSQNASPGPNTTTHPVPGSTPVADNTTHFVSGITTYSTRSTPQTMSHIPIITPHLEASVGVFLSLVALL